MSRLPRPLRLIIAILPLLAVALLVAFRSPRAPESDLVSVVVGSPGTELEFAL